MGDRAWGCKQMKTGDLVTIKDNNFTRVEGMIEYTSDVYHPKPEFHEMGIIVDISEILGNQYAQVWWFSYDTRFKGKPSETIPCQYLQVL